MDIYFPFTFHWPLRHAISILTAITCPGSRSSQHTHAVLVFVSRHNIDIIYVTKLFDVGLFDARFRYSFLDLFTQPPGTPILFPYISRIYNTLIFDTLRLIYSLIYGHQEPNTFISCYLTRDTYYYFADLYTKEQCNSHITCLMLILAAIHRLIDLR